MTKKDYELLAYALKLSKPGPPELALATDETFVAYDAQWTDTASCIADALVGDNPRFDRARFLKACGVS